MDKKPPIKTSLEISAPSSWAPQDIVLPGSKYVANRLLIMAALSEEEVTLRNLPRNNDIEVSMAGLSQLGLKITSDNHLITTKGVNPLNPRKDLPKLTQTPLVLTHESGTFSRFVLSVAALFSQNIEISGAPRMNQRPMESLTTVLKELQATIQFKEKPHHLPLTIRGPIKGGDITIAGDISSQYISSLLMTLPLCEEDSQIKLSSDLISKSYIDLTIELLKKFSITITVNEANPLRPTYQISGKQTYRPQVKTITIESDPVSSTYFMAAAVLANQSITIPHFNSKGIQGETYFYQILQKMGAEITLGEDSITVTKKAEIPLKSVAIDMGTMPDAVPTLCVLAACAEGTTEITNIAHLRYKESNRIDDMANELKKAGVKITTSQDSMTIEGVPKEQIKPTTFNSHNDHRLAMSLSLMAIITSSHPTNQKIIIEDAEAVKKSFPNYYHCLGQLGFVSSVLKHAK